MFKRLILAIVAAFGVVAIVAQYNNLEGGTLIPQRGSNSKISKVVMKKNAFDLIPLKRLDTLSINFGNKNSRADSLIAEYVNLYLPIEKRESGNLHLFTVQNKTDIEVLDLLIKSKQQSKIIVISDRRLKGEIIDQVDVVLDIPEFSDFYCRKVPQLLFGGEAITRGDYLTTSLHRLSYDEPENRGIDGVLLHAKLDSLVKVGIDSMAFPGCQILVAKDGAVVYHNTFGFTTYDKVKPINKELIYDWASITKITAPLPLLMRMYEQNRLNLDIPFANYWTRFKKTNKRAVTLREILAHQAGLAAWLPYWTQTKRKSGRFKRRHVRSYDWSKAATQFSDSLWANPKFRKQIFCDIDDSPLLKKKEYKYSGLCFFLFPTLIEQMEHRDYEQMLQDDFFAPLGATSVGFNPLKHGVSRDLIVPTEYDSLFRKQQIHGWVHDEGAAIMGGVSGNAGLFGTTNDLAKIMQMYMQMGTYGGKHYFKEETLKEFTRVQYKDNENRRGLGFDKPYIDNSKNELVDAYPAVSTSENSFGHGGYTGTFAWADPDNQLLFIFMSNRVYPTRNNTKLYDLNLRPQLHQAIYDCIK